jgi:hypothetical protein
MDAVARSLAIALLFAVGQISAPAIAADRISMRVEVFGPMGLHVLTLRTSVEQAGEQYAINADYRTTGIAGLVVDQKTKAAASGQLISASAQPISFRRDTVRNGVERRDHVDYRPDGTVEARSTPAVSEPITPTTVRGTVDNLTAYFRLERQLATKGTCGLTVPVFDGRYRYDLVFTDAGKQALSPEGGQRWQGTTISCRMASHNRGPADPEQSEGARKGILWYAPLLPGAIVVPVRMQLETQIGSVDAYLAELHGLGVDLRLME